MRMTMLLFAVACLHVDPPEFTTDVQIDGKSPNSSVNSLGLQMCATDDGGVYAIWMDNRRNPQADRVDIWMNHAPPGASFERQPTRVNHGDGNVWNPTLHCDDDAVFVVWEDDRDGELHNHEIYFQRSLDGGQTFLDADLRLEVNEPGSTMSLEPRITGSGEDLMVAWYGSANGAYDVFVTTSGDRGESWRLPVRLDSDEPLGSAYSARPQVAMSPDGRGMWVVWEDSRDGRADIYVARSEDGGVQWRRDQRLDVGDDPGQEDSFEPRLCTANGQDVVVVWKESQEPAGLRYVSSLNAGASWSEPAMLQDPSAWGTPTFDARCVSDGSTAHVVWVDQRDQRWNAYYGRILLGERVPERTVSADGLASNLRNPVPSLDPLTGTFAVAWLDDRAAEDPELGDIYYQYFEGGEPGGASPRDYRVDSMFSGLSAKFELQFAVRNNRWFASWVDGRGLTADVFFQSMGIGTASKPPPTDLMDL